MSEQDQTAKPWGGRFSEATDTFVERFTASIGFDWKTSANVVDKIEEEVEELRQAVNADTTERCEEEMGDLLFSIANLSRKLGIEPEGALRRANQKFCDRFERLVKRLRAVGRSLQDASFEEMEAAWQTAKKES